MIISAVADPRIFGNQVVVDEFTKREVIRFLESVAESGVLIDDADRFLIEEWMRFAQQLRTHLGQRILLYLQDFVTKAKKYLVSSGSRINQERYRATPEAQLVSIAGAMRVDAIVTSRSQFSQFGALDTTVAAYGLVPVEDWSIHGLESHRKQLLNPSVPLDELEPHECEERVGRALKYASSIRVLDAHLVASEQRAPKFFQGISYLVSVWERWAISPTARLSIEVYTLGNCKTQNGFLTGQDARARLKRFIVDPLQISRRCTASGFVKSDCDPPIFHARFIQAKTRTYSLDPGFDAFNSSGPMRRCFFRLESAGESHVADCLKLRNAV
jgi:hypothetical protein